MKNPITIIRRAWRQYQLGILYTRLYHIRRMNDASSAIGYLYSKGWPMPIDAIDTLPIKTDDGFKWSVSLQSGFIPNDTNSYSSGHTKHQALCKAYQGMIEFIYDQSPDEDFNN